MTASDSQKQCIAIRTGLGGKASTDISSGTRAIVNNECLPQAGTKTLGDDSCDRIVGTPWSMGYDDRDWFVWVRLGCCRPGRQCERRPNRKLAVDFSY